MSYNYVIHSAVFYYNVVERGRVKIMNFGCPQAVKR